MGEFSTVFAIRSILEKQPSICIRGIKLQHLKAALKELDIDFGKEDAEMRSYRQVLHRRERVQNCVESNLYIVVEGNRYVR